MVGRHIDWIGKGVDERGVDARSGDTLIQVDPIYYRPTETGELLGIKQLQELIHEEFPQVKFGYFNPPMERISGNYEADFAH